MINEILAISLAVLSIGVLVYNLFKTKTLKRIPVKNYRYVCTHCLVGSHQKPKKGD